MIASGLKTSILEGFIIVLVLTSTPLCLAQIESKYGFLYIWWWVYVQMTRKKLQHHFQPFPGLQNRQINAVISVERAKSDARFDDSEAK